MAPKIQPKQITRIGEVINRVSTALTVGGTTAETTIYSVTVPAGALGADGFLQVQIIGTFVANVLLGTNYTLRFKFGGVTIYQDASPNIAQSATLRAFNYNVMLANRANVAIQTGGGNLNLSEAGSPTVGIGTFSATDTAQGTVRFLQGAANTALAQMFECTVQHGSANAGVVTVRDAANAILFSSN